MTVVSDTSPLHYLVLIGAEGVLPRLFGDLHIPRGVREELAAAEAPDPIRRWIAAPPDWLRIHDAPSGFPEALAALHHGEREVIMLARVLSADLLLLDDRPARTLAERAGLRVAGTLAVLNRAGAQGWIDIPEVVERLRSTTFRAVPALYDWLLEQHRHRAT